VLDGAAVVGDFEVEAGFGALTGAALGQVGDGAAGGVVPVAERLVAQGRGAAAVSAGEDVAALVAFWLGWFWLFGSEYRHGGLPYLLRLLNSSKQKA
jgi:hypothetical protein